MTCVTLKDIKAMNKSYNCDQSVDAPNMKEGVEFYCVGANGTHEFYLGLLNGQLYSAASGAGSYKGPKGGCDCNERMVAEGNKGNQMGAIDISMDCEDTHYPYEFSIRKTDKIGYIGNR